MSRQEAVEQYNIARKAGTKYYKACVARGRYPYPQVLDELIDESRLSGREELGIIDVPIDKIVGMRNNGRKTAFAANFLPLLDNHTEFATKWIDLCESHLEVGIHDPIRCYEYLGRFYVQEGNKRVSVLRSYGAASIAGRVTRLLPAPSDDEEIRAYEAFLNFYRLAGLYQVQMRHEEEYARLQTVLGFESDHVWTAEERRHFLAGYYRFREAFDKCNTENLPLHTTEAMLVFLEIYSVETLYKEMQPQLTHLLQAIWPDIVSLTRPQPFSVSTEPVESTGLHTKFWMPTISHLNVAFIYTGLPGHSPWIWAHDQGREYLMKKYPALLRAESYMCDAAHAFETMEMAISEGAEVIFAVTPQLMAACRRIAALHPNVKILNCALSMPYAGVRTYYSRIFEAKYITGAIAGAMATEDRIGYIADYPIYGVPAAINAFALGARLTNPRARIELRWSCLPGDAERDFKRDGIRVISGLANDPEKRGLYQLRDDGSTVPLASAEWNWGRMYEKILTSIFTGAWDAVASKDNPAVNYWWGMSSRVIDVNLDQHLPDGLRRLAEFLRSGIIGGDISPFRCRICDQTGTERCDDQKWLTPEEIMQMDWLCDSVDGFIPSFDQLLPISRETVRLMGLHRSEITVEEVRHEDSAAGG